MMNPTVKVLVLDALRSDKYEQGQYRLRRGDKFCCLGVVCDLHSQATGIAWEDDDTYLEAQDTLPPEVQKWARLENSNPSTKYHDSCLAGLNDEGHSFATIADVIEKEL